MKNMVNTELIKDYIRTHNLSKTKFCKLCKIHPTTLKNILENKNFVIKAIFKIANVLDVDICNLFQLTN